ncbi:hypothetical protein D187_008740 [Cystobacter fuscus DSM 2262]|uniref:Uncharacterized protein n=1 Tax=Cystobacter fuscus (strain ATCC 25194 / DSM 2262 / NBRC 100088 / M29) TaxID=1242864 RepID=S9PJG5_CYSF2|nr:hypothetical protein [Cystobacter fuscus]EPX62552.1 hypothetical protein D187_008740 [Cystobacter fuscus DSM 2262]
MSGALKVGDVFVAVSASLNEFTKGIDELLENVEEAADAIEGAMSKAAAALGDFSEGLLSVAAVAGAAVAGAAESNEAAKKAADDLKASMLQLSSEVGAVFLPLVRELTEGVRTLTATWRGLGAEQKQQLVSFVRYSAIVGAAGLATSRALLFTKSLFEGTVVLARGLRTLNGGLGILATGLRGAGPLLTRLGWQLVYLKQASMGDVFAAVTASLRTFAANLRALPGQAGGLGSAFKSMLPTLLAVGAPVLAITAAVAALVLLAGSLYRAWNRGGAGLKEVLAGVGESVRGLAAQVKDTFVGIFDAFMEFALGLASAFLEVLAAKVRAVAAFAEEVARKAGRENWADNLAQVQKLSGTGMVKAIVGQVSPVVDAARQKLASAGAVLKSIGKETGQAIGYGLSESVGGLKDLFQDTGLAGMKEQIENWLQGLMPKVGDPSSVSAPDDREAAAARYADWVKKQDASLREALYEDAAAANKALAAEAAAIEETVRQVEREAQEASEMAQLQAEASLEAAEDARRAQAAEAEQAVEAWRASRDEARRLAEAVADAREALASNLASRTGNLQGLVQSAGQGAMVGGPVGAAVAVGLDLLTQSEGFQQIIEMVNTVIQQVADALGSFLVPLQPLVASVLRLVPIIANALGPVFSFIGQLLEPLVPVFYVIGEVLQVLEPLLQMFAGALQLVAMPIKLLVDTALRMLFEGLKMLGVALLALVRGISWLWNGLVEGVQLLLRTLAHLPFLDGLNKVADELEAVKVDRDALKQSQEELLNLTYEQARAKAAETAATIKNTKALQEATESLTNVPAAWRVAQRRFQAQDARTSPLLPAGLAPSTAQAAPAQTAAPAIAIGTVNVSGEDTGRALAKLEQHLNNLSFRNRGTRAGPGRYAVEGG